MAACGVNEVIHWRQSEVAAQSVYFNVVFNPGAAHFVLEALRVIPRTPGVAVTPRSIALAIPARKFICHVSKSQPIGQSFGYSRPGVPKRNLLPLAELR